MMIEQNIMEELRKFNALSRRQHEHPHGDRRPERRPFPPGGPHGGWEPMGPRAPFMPAGPDGMPGNPCHPGKDKPFQHGTFRILDKLSETEGISQTQLADLLEIRPQSVSESVRGLAARGLVRKELCGDDRRAVRIFLTEEGAIFRAEIQEMREHQAAKRFAALTDEEKQELLRILKKLNEQAAPAD